MDTSIIKMQWNATQYNRMEMNLYSTMVHRCRFVIIIVVVVVVVVVVLCSYFSRGPRNNYVIQATLILPMVRMLTMMMKQREKYKPQQQMSCE